MRLAVAACLWLLPALCPAAPQVSGELGYGYDSNANRARRNAGYEREAHSLRGAVALDETWTLGRSAALMLQGGVDGEHHLDFDGLSNARATALARLFWRGGRGFHAPTLALTGAASHWDFDSRQRDSTEYRASLHLTETLTTRLAARLGVLGVWRHARGEVFDLAAHSVLLDLDWALRPRLLAYAGYQYREGDLVVTAPGVAPPAAKASAPDDAFDRSGDTVFRLAADAHIGTLGFNYALTPQLALDVQSQFVWAEADLGSRYERWLSSAGVLFRF